MSRAFAIRMNCVGIKKYLLVTVLQLSFLSGIGYSEKIEENKVKTLDVMTFNVRHGLALDRRNSWKNRKDLVVEVIEKYSPDIFGLQESYPFQTDFIHENLEGYKWFGIDREAVGVGEMCPIFYRTDRFLLMEGATRWLSNTPEVPGSNSWRAAFPRVVTWGKFKDLESGEFIYIYNTHYDHRSRYARSKSTQMIINMIDDKVELGQRLIVLGDFNENATSSDSHKTYLSAQFKDSWQQAIKKNWASNYFFEIL